MARKAPRVRPVPRPPVLDDFAGEWVALKDDAVIAHGSTAREVIEQMRALGDAASDAVLLRAASSTEALAVGLG